MRVDFIGLKGRREGASVQVVWCEKGFLQVAKLLRVFGLCSSTTWPDVMAGKAISIVYSRRVHMTLVHTSLATLGVKESLHLIMSSNMV